MAIEKKASKLAEVSIVCATDALSTVRHDGLVFRFALERVAHLISCDTNPIHNSQWPTNQTEPSSHSNNTITLEYDNSITF